MQAVQVLTALLLAAFVGYIGSWYMGLIEGNFALLLFLATVVTGAYWLGERFYFLPQRRKAAQAIEEAAVQRVSEYRNTMLEHECYPLAFVWHHEDQTDIAAFMPLLRVRS